MGNCNGNDAAKGVSVEQDLEQKQALVAPPELKNVKGESPPQHWVPIPKLKGSGQCEFQGYDTWTAQEQQEWKDGHLQSKWGVGQVSIRLPIRNCVALTALVYGYLPFLIPIWWFVWVVSSWIMNGSPRFFPLYGLLIAIGFAIINETLTKQICRRALSTDITNRPPEAVCKHPGMPSGHVMNAYTLMTWCFLEAILDIHIYPEWLLAVVLVMGPVPWARVYNKDHTVPQVVVSGCIAVVMGVVAYALRSRYFNSHTQGHTAPWTWYHMGEGYDNMLYS